MDAKESAAGRMNSPRGPDLARGPEVADRCPKLYSVLRIMLITVLFVQLIIVCALGANLSVDMTLPKEVVERIETEDDLCESLEFRQVIGYASYGPTPNLLPFSHLSLYEPASRTEVD